MRLLANAFRRMSMTPEADRIYLAALRKVSFDQDPLEYRQIKKNVSLSVVIFGSDS